MCGITGAGVAQPTVSRRLKKLHEAGLLTSGRHGTWVCRKAAPPVVAAVPVLLDLR